ncbi:insulinase family protein, partial [Clostridium botulinum]|nr:insulinase family protein [Clostridium botulinum]
CINKLAELKNSIDMEDIKQLIKSYKLKKLFKEEKSIVLAKEISTYDTMFGDYKVYTNENLDNITKEDIFDVGIKTLKNPSIEIIY